MKLLQCTQHTKYLQQPNYNNDNNYCIKNVFDGMLHGNESINEPKNYSNSNEDENNGYNGHNNVFYL
jgi:hypothetical protein